MGKATLAHQKAIGLIGLARANKLRDEGPLTVLFTSDYEQLVARVAELERRCKLLSDAQRDREDVAALVLREAMGR